MFLLVCGVCWFCWPSAFWCSSAEACQCMSAVLLAFILMKLPLKNKNKIKKTNGCGNSTMKLNHS